MIWRINVILVKKNIFGNQYEFQGAKKHFSCKKELQRLKHYVNVTKFKI